MKWLLAFQLFSSSGQQFFYDLCTTLCVPQRIPPQKVTLRLQLIVKSVWDIILSVGYSIKEGRVALICQFLKRTSVTVYFLTYYASSIVGTEQLSLQLLSWELRLHPSFFSNSHHSSPLLVTLILSCSVHSSPLSFLLHASPLLFNPLLFTLLPSPIHSASLHDSLLSSPLFSSSTPLHYSPLPSSSLRFNQLLSIPLHPTPFLVNSLLFFPPLFFSFVQSTSVLFTLLSSFHSSLLSSTLLSTPLYCPFQSSAAFSSR